MRPSLLTIISGLSLLLMAIGAPQQAFAAGKFDGEWKGQLNCSKIEPFGQSRTSRITGTEIRSNVKLIIRNGRVFGQKGLFSGKVDMSENQVKINLTLPKVGSLLIKGKYLDADGERLISFESGGTQDDDSECQFYLTWSGAATDQLASKATPKPIAISASATQSASAAGKFDGDWKGTIVCGEVNEDIGGWAEQQVQNGTALRVEIRNSGQVTKFIWNGGDDSKITVVGTFQNEGIFASSVNYVNDDGYPDSLKIRGEYISHLLLKWNWNSISSRQPSFYPCQAKLTRENNAQLIQAWETNDKNRPQIVVSNPSEDARISAMERQRLQQEIAALKEQNEESRRLAENERKRIEAERKRQEEAKHLAEIKRNRKEKEALRLAVVKRKSEANRVADIERKREVEAKRLADIKLKRKAKAKRIAAAERKRKDEVKRISALEKKRKSAEAKKRKAAQQSASTIGGGGKVQQQLAFLKQLRADGLINKQQFETKQQALLDRFLGLGSIPSTKVSSAVEPKNSELEKNLAKYSDVKFGTYHALIIGSNNYKYLPKLKTAKSDAKAIAKTLKSKYGYKVKTLIDASRIDILDAFDEYREILTKDDNLLIYYAGHGYLDEAGDRGYWMPVDARPNRRGAWLSNADITDTLKALKAKHVMVMADSCYSGTLTRGLSIKERSSDYIREAVAKKTRVVITSGGLEPVADKSGGNHSPFASVFLDILNSNNGVLDGTKLFNKMRRPVMLKADQTPAYSDVRKAGHEGGDFLFVRRK